ncbi:3'(2'),5'-bisphosphate nucleotidase CysQ [soil metagenome]
MNDYASLLSQAVPIAVEAGEAVMEVYGRDFSTTEKDDKSPLTEADMASHHKIIAGLEKIDPSIPILSEESKAIPYEDRAGWTRFWLVDPLDGTKEFIKRNGEFTVNIALIENGEAVLGVVHAPVLGITYAAARGVEAYKEVDGTKSPIHVADFTGKDLKVVASRSHAGPETEALIEDLRSKVGDVELVSKGSSLKLCMVADGEAHLYPRLGPTMEWDVAAAHAVVEGAGGTVTDTKGEPFRYNKENLLNPFFIVSGTGDIPLGLPL